MGSIVIDQEIELLLRTGQEERNLEYKESGPWEDYKYKITKSALAMSNIRNGGKIVVGVVQAESGFNPVGMEDAHLVTYDDDDILDFISRYADPFVNVGLKRAEHKGKKYLVIQVSEFHDVPVICKKDGNENLCKGVLYTRPYSDKRQTCPVRSQTEMREILDLAIEKGMRKFLETTHRIGAVLPTPPEDSSREQFEKQLGGL